MEKKEKNNSFYSESYSKNKRVIPQTSPKSYLSYLILFIYFDTPFNSLSNALFIYFDTPFNALFNSGGVSLSLSLSHARAKSLFLLLSLTLFFFALFNPCFVSLSYVKFLRRNSKIFSPLFVWALPKQKKRESQLALSFSFLSPRQRLRPQLCKL